MAMGITANVDVVVAAVALGADQDRVELADGDQALGVHGAIP